MSDPAGLPAPARAFLDQAPDALLVTESGPPGVGGKYPRVLLAVADRAALRRLSRSGQVPREVRSSTIGVWLDEATAALSYLARPTPRAPSLTAIRSRAEGEGWLCVLRFDRPTSVGRVLEQLAQQAVAPAIRVPPPAPVDLRVINPAGFDADASAPVVPVSTLDLSRGVTEALVRSLRPVLGVRLDVDPDPTARLALAAAGVPLVADGDDLDLADRSAREEHSIRSRRRAIDELAPPETRPSVSIVMATRRPEMLEHAVGQVAHQIGVSELELVLAPHGFEPDVGRVRALLGPAASLQVAPQPASMIFGDVLNAAVAVAGGDLILKMDDDDWYAPEFVADELRARVYSGADLVGTPDELYYLAEPDVTVQRRHPGEMYTQFVAGGTLLLARSLLRELGGFESVPSGVDRRLLDALDLAAASMYRTHGLGYLLRRNATGHTYETDIAKILDPAQVIATWPGQRLGPLHGR